MEWSKGKIKSRSLVWKETWEAVERRDAIVTRNKRMHVIVLPHRLELAMLGPQRLKPVCSAKAEVRHCRFVILRQED